MTFSLPYALDEQLELGGLDLVRPVRTDLLARAGGMGRSRRILRLNLHDPAPLRFAGFKLDQDGGLFYLLD